MAGIYLRITRTGAEELDTATLNTAWVAGRSLRVCLVSVLLRHLTIVTGVRVDDAADHTQLLCPLDFEASEDSTVTCNGNVAFELHASIDKVLVITVGAVVNVDKGAGDIATGGIAVESWDAVLERSCRVILQDILGERCLERNLPVLSVVVLALLLFEEAKAVVL